MIFIYNIKEKYLLFIENKILFKLMIYLKFKNSRKCLWIPIENIYLLNNEAHESIFLFDILN